MKEKEDKDVFAYVGFDDMGNILGAVVHEDSNRERSAVWIAAWVMDGLHVKRMTVAEVRVSFGRDFEGPDLPPTAPYHVRVMRRGEKGELIKECEGTENFFGDDWDDDEDDFEDDVPDYEKLSYEELDRRQKREEEAKAFEILELLCGNDNWKRLRTLGDFDNLRLEIAGVNS